MKNRKKHWLLGYIKPLGIIKIKGGRKKHMDSRISVNFHASQDLTENIVVEVDRTTCAPDTILLRIHSGDRLGLCLFLNQKSLGRIQDAILFDRLKNPRSIEEDMAVGEFVEPDAPDAQEAGVQEPDWDQLLALIPPPPSPVEANHD